MLLTDKRSLKLMIRSPLSQWVVTLSCNYNKIITFAHKLHENENIFRARRFADNFDDIIIGRPVSILKYELQMITL